MTICTLTESAKAQINKLCEENGVWGISLNIKGGGCAGFEYDWGTVANPEDTEIGDEIINADGDGHFVIGVHSVMFLAGSEIDYVKNIFGAQFEIRNPLAKGSCGCGVSVNFDIDKLVPQV